MPAMPPPTTITAPMADCVMGSSFKDYNQCR
jgi:hypothetical protein